MERPKLFGIEVLRFLACCMIVTTHVASAHVAEPSPSWWLVNWVVSFSRGGAALFLMVTGALLLPRQEPILSVWRNRMGRVALPLVFWGLVYWGWDILWKAAPPPGTPWLGAGHYHLWYLYTILGIYAILPLLRRLWQGCSSHERIYALVGWLIVASLLPAVKTVLKLPVDPVISFNLQNFGGLVGYLWLGAFLMEQPKDKISPWWYLLGFVVLRCGLALAVREWSVIQGRPDGFFYDHLSPFVVLSTALLFCWCLSLATPEAKREEQIKWGARLSFGVYLIHPMIIEALSHSLGVFYGSWHLYWSMPLLLVLTLPLSFWVTAQLEKIDWLKPVL